MLLASLSLCTQQHTEDKLTPGWLWRLKVTESFKYCHFELNYTYFNWSYGCKTHKDGLLLDSPDIFFSPRINTRMKYWIRFWKPYVALGTIPQCSSCMLLGCVCFCLCASPSPMDQQPSQHTSDPLSSHFTTLKSLSTLIYQYFTNVFVNLSHLFAFFNIYMHLFVIVYGFFFWQTNSKFYCLN